MTGREMKCVAFGLGALATIVVAVILAVVGRCILYPLARLAVTGRATIECRGPE